MDFLWTAAGATLTLSYFLYSPESSTSGSQATPLGWLFRSWPALFALAGTMWLLLDGPLSGVGSWIQKGCRVVLGFFVYSGFLYFLRWSPFWAMMRSLGFTDKNKETGVLILIATIVWICDGANNRAWRVEIAVSWVSDTYGIDRGAGVEVDSNRDSILGSRRDGGGKGADSANC